MVKSTDVIVIGGGIIGLFSAYMLLRQGAEVVLVDKGFCGSGQSVRTGGGIRWHHASELNRALTKISAYIWEEFLPDLNYKDTGHLFLTNSTEQNENFKLQVLNANEDRISSELLSKEVLIDRWKLNFNSGIYCNEGGYLDQHKTIELLRSKVIYRGGKIKEGFHVLEILKNSNGEVYGVKSGDGQLVANYVVNAAGSHAGQVASTCGHELPIISRRHELLIAKTELELDFPWLIDVDAQVHIRPNQDQTVLFGGFLGHDPEAHPDQYNMNYENDWVRAVLKAVRHSFGIAIEQSAIIDGWAGLYPGTPDYHPVLEISKPGLITAAGFSGTGLMHAPAVGVIVADLITQGKTNIFGIENLNSSRFDRPTRLQDKSGF